MANDTKLHLTERSALRLFEALGEFLHTGQHSDADAYSDDNMIEMAQIRRDLAVSLRGPALQAIKNLTNSHKDVLFGNGVNTDGELYEDVHEGLELAYAILGAI